MSGGVPSKKPATDPNKPAGSPPGSGEGAQSALLAMLKKRQQRAELDDPTLPFTASPTQAQQPQKSHDPGDAGERGNPAD